MADLSITVPGRSVRPGNLAIRTLDDGTAQVVLSIAGKVMAVYPVAGDVREFAMELAGWPGGS